MAKEVNPCYVVIIVWVFSLLRPLSCGVHILLDDEWNLPQSFIPAEEGVQIFRGNHTLENSFFQLHLEEDSVLIAARNTVYNLSMLTFRESKPLVWHSKPSDVQICLLKQKTAEECQNYIRLMIRTAKDVHLICGTNAFRPSCRTYSPVEFQKQGCSVSYNDEADAFVCEEIGVARCPYDPTHNSSAVYAGGRLFFATVADVSARDSLIFSSPLRTEQHDSQWLNDPDFVSSYEFDDKVYFFFRETAIENINCGKTVFSRVARVCTNDRGGERVLRNTWTSFFKARLNCSIPGEFPFYFDEIQSTSELGNGNVFPTLILNDRVPMVYGVFTTPRNSLRGSAICAFRFSDIIAAFEGPFKEQRSAHSNWLPVRESDVPNPHPAKSCLNDTFTLSDQMLNFIKWHPLMDRAVPAFGGQPVIIQASFNFSFTQVAVDWQVYAADHRYYDVLFIGTDDGHVVKVINRGRGQNLETEVTEIIKVFPGREPVISLKVYQNAERRLRKLVVLSKNEMRSLPLHRCSLKTTCSSCVALKDPYCSWLGSECVDSDLGLQSIETGRHARCPPTEDASASAEASEATASSLPKVHCPPCLCPLPETTTSGSDACLQASLGSYSSSSVALAAVLSIIFSLSAGFTIGYLVATKKHSTSCTLQKREKLSFNCKNKKIQNHYEIEGTPHHICNERCSTLTNGKQCNVYNNELKGNNVQLVNGVNLVDSLDRQKTRVHL